MGCLCVLVAAIALRPPAPASVAQFTRTAVLRSAAATAAGALAAASQAAPPPEMLLREAAAQAAANEPKVLYTPPSVKGVSTPDELALAQYLKKKGAKFYGAYWCPFCTRQRAMFGAAGVRALPYVECASDGYGAQRCPPQVTGFPTWEIDGQFYSGLKTLTQLQSLAGFDAAVVFPAPPPPPPPPAMPPGGFRQPAITEPSTPEQVQLATHLKQSGAVFYGAYWCKANPNLNPDPDPNPNPNPNQVQVLPAAASSLRYGGRRRAAVCGVRGQRVRSAEVPAGGGWLPHVEGAWALTTRNVTLTGPALTPHPNPTLTLTLSLSLARSVASSTEATCR